MTAPTLRSERQIQTRMLAKLISELSLNDITPGSIVDVLTQASAQEDFALYFALAQIARLRDLNALTRADLDNRAFEYGLTRYAAVAASGLVTIQRAASFEKLATNFFAGDIPPVIGALTLKVNDASDALYSTAGTLIVGRGTNTEEEVDYSIAPVDNATYWQFTIDAPGFVYNHAPEETVILKQDIDRTVTAGTVVKVLATGIAPEIQFTLNNDAVVLAGEADETGIRVTATETGTKGNIGVRGIGGPAGDTAFSSAPFTGARAYNPAKFTTGRDRETDDALRDRIRSAGDLLTRGVKNAILQAIVGLLDAETTKRVVSANVILPTAETGDVKVYIDDGTGFEPDFAQIGNEPVRTNATGGEVRLQLNEFPLVKAYLETGTEELYDFSSGSKTLIYEVNQDEETITFSTTDFVDSEHATAEEIASIINDNATLIEARTSQTGTKVVITAVSDTGEDLEITGGTANAILGFSEVRQYTLNLYKNDVLLSKDGRTAFIDSGNEPPYDLLAIGAFPHELLLVVDGKTANEQTAVFQSADAADTSNVTAAEVAAVINRDISGVIATDITTGVRITSNLPLSADSKIKINSGSLNDATNGLNFSTTIVVGSDSDYTLNRELGIIEMTDPLTEDDNVTAGNEYSRGHIRASIAENYAPANTLTLVIKVDGGSGQTVTFDGTSRTAEEAADFINLTLRGGTAYAREIGGENFLEIQTNNFASATGIIEVDGASTANAAFGFTLDTNYTSITPDRAYVATTSNTPYVFVEDSNLVIVVDDDIVNKTFNIIMNYAGTLTGATSTTVFAATGLATPFPTNDEINGYYLAFLTGTNAATDGTIDEVNFLGGTTYEYSFAVAPAEIADFAIGDLFSAEDLDDAGNNGKFIITAIAGGYVRVSNPNGVAATLQSGTSVLSSRRAVTDYVGATGSITTAAFPDVPAIGNTFILLPYTASNIDDFLNNVHVTPLSLKAEISAVGAAAIKVQIASLENGSDGAIQVTGGSANTALAFSTTQVDGVNAYAHWTGLVKLVHQTVYGDDTDLTSYPGVGAAGITFRILAPTVSQIAFVLDVTLKEGVTLASLENEIKSAITGYVNGLGVGEDVVLEQARSAVIQIDGVVDVSISTPTANEAAADNEVIRVSDSDITLG